MAHTCVSTSSASSYSLFFSPNPSASANSDSQKLSLAFHPFRSWKSKKLISAPKNLRNSSPKAVYSGKFWAPEMSYRQGIWSIRDDLQIPSSPYFPAYAQGQGPPAMVQERFQSVISQLFQHRIIRCGGAVDDDMANVIVAQLLYLDAVDPQKDIVMYVNSPGGSVTAGMAIFDTMRHIRPDVSTVCVGLAARNQRIFCNLLYKREEISRDWGRCSSSFPATLRLPFPATFGDSSSSSCRELQLFVNSTANHHREPSCGDVSSSTTATFRLPGEISPFFGNVSAPQGSIPLPHGRIYTSLASTVAKTAGIRDFAAVPLHLPSQILLISGDFSPPQDLI